MRSPDFLKALDMRSGDKHRTNGQMQREYAFQVPLELLAYTQGVKERPPMQVNALIMPSRPAGPQFVPKAHRLTQPEKRNHLMTTFKP
jgi:hypothetical protein